MLEEDVGALPSEWKKREGLLVGCLLDFDGGGEEILAQWEFGISLKTGIDT